MNVTKFDASEYLSSPEMARDYLQVMLEENGVSGLQKALGDIAKAKGMTEVARETKLGRPSLYRALSEGGKPQFETIDKVIRALGFKLTIENEETAHLMASPKNSQRLRESIAEIETGNTISRELIEE